MTNQSETETTTPETEVGEAPSQEPRETTEVTQELAEQATETTVQQDATTEPEAPQDATSDETSPKDAREAAKYRRRLRDTEGQLQATQAQVEKVNALLAESRLQLIISSQREVLNSTTLPGPARVFHSESAARENLTPELVASLFTETGELDKKLARKTFDDLAKDKPWLFTTQGKLLGGMSTNMQDHNFHANIGGEFEGSIMSAFDSNR